MKCLFAGSYVDFQKLKAAIAQFLGKTGLHRLLGVFLNLEARGAAVSRVKIIDNNTIWQGGFARIAVCRFRNRIR